MLVVKWRMIQWPKNCTTWWMIRLHKLGKRGMNKALMFSHNLKTHCQVKRKIEISFLILETAAKASANSPKVYSEAKSRNLKQKIFHIFITAGVDFCNRVSVWSFASPLSLSLSLSTKIFTIFYFFWSRLFITQRPVGWSGHSSSWCLPYCWN